MRKPAVDDLVERYFAGDLDQVERRELESSLAHSEELQRQFDRAYDERTARLGFMALESSEPALDECFSPTTLDRFVDDDLDAVDEAAVQQHLACPLCRREVEARKRRRGAPGRALSLPAKLAGWGIAAAAAAALWVVALPGPAPEDTPRFRGVERFEDTAQAIFTVEQADGARTVDLEALTLRAGQRVVVEVHNASERNAMYFAIAAVGPAQEVRWLHPRSDGLVPANFAKLDPADSDEVDLGTFGPDPIRLVALLTDASVNTLVAEAGVLDPNWNPAAELRRVEVEVRGPGPAP